MNNRIAHEIETIVGSERFRYEGECPVVTPVSEEQIAAVLGKATKERIPVVVKGGGMMPVPCVENGCVVLSTKGLNSDTSVSPDDLIVETDAGVETAILAEACKSEGFTLPLDIRQGSTATIGGAFSSGAYGISGYVAEALRGSVIGCRAVTAYGDSITGGGKTVKNVTGYDVPRFLAGTMGMFAVVTRLTLKMTPLPPVTKYVTASISSLVDCAELVRVLMKTDHSPEMIEVAGKNVSGVCLFVEYSGVGDVVETAVESLLELFEKHGATDLQVNHRDSGGKIVSMRNMEAQHDWQTFALSPAAVPGFLAKAEDVGGTWDVIAQPLYGTMLVGVSDEDPILEKLTAFSMALGGKRPVSHRRVMTEGVGHLYSPEEFAIITRLKKRLDPSGILNSVFAV